MTVQKKYVESGGEVCPFCGGEVKTIGPLENGGGKAWQECRCIACKKRWTDQYQLTGFSQP